MKLGWEAGSDIQFQNLHVMEKAHWGFKVFFFRYRISRYSHFDFILLKLVAFWKQSNFFFFYK